MKINAQITLLFNEDGLHLEVHDDEAGITFVEMQLTQEQTCQAFSRLFRTHVADCEVRYLEYVGKKQELKTITFPLPSDDYDKNALTELAKKEAKKHTPKGWEADNYYGSQDSFFKKDGKQYAKTTIRRWVTLEE